MYKKLNVFSVCQIILILALVISSISRIIVLLTNPSVENFLILIISVILTIAVITSELTTSYDDINQDISDDNFEWQQKHDYFTK